MKKLIIASCVAFLSVAQAYAEEQPYVDEAVDLEELAGRLNRIPPQQYMEIKAPSEESAHRAAQKLTPQEIKILVSSQNKINKRIAEQNGEAEPKPVEIDMNDKKAIEEFLTPDIYTYDDM